MKSILIVDDDSSCIKELGDVLSPYYRVRAANSVNGAMKVLSRFDDIELIVLDVIMPFDTGYDMIEKVKTNSKYSAIPIVFISELDDAMDEYRGFELGGVDYIRKPISPSVLLARVNRHVDISIERKKLKRHIDRLEVEIRKNNGDENKFKELILIAMSYLSKINITTVSLHNIKINQYMRILIQQLKADNLFNNELNDSLVENILLSVPLHDIGKVGLHDNLVEKDGKYTLDDISLMQEHARLGAEALEHASNDLKLDVCDYGYVSVAIDMAHYHHERWDGNGYPEGLEHYEIPLSARLMSVVDVFDALTCERVYRKNYTFDEAKQILIDGKNTQFDPDIVDAFIRCFNEIVNIDRIEKDEKL